MRKSEVLLSLALLGSVALSVSFWSDLRAERTRSAELDARLTTPPPVTPALPEQPAQASQPPEPALQPVVATSASAKPAAAKSQRVVQGSEQDYQRQRPRDPKYREVWRQQQRLEYAPRRERLIRLLGLTPEEADAVTDLDIDRNLYWIEHPPPKDQPREQLQALFDAQAKDHQDKLRALLGNEKNAKLQAYMESRPSRIQVDRHRSQMTGAETLRDDQVEALIAALHVENAKMRKEREEYRASNDWRTDAASATEDSEHEIERLKVAHGRVLASAASILSGTQLEKLDLLLKRDLERQETEARMNILQSGGH